MSTDRNTLESLERINEAIKVLVEEQKILSRHLAQQKRQVAWDTDEDGKTVYRPSQKEE